MGVRGMRAVVVVTGEWASRGTLQYWALHGGVHRHLDTRSTAWQD